MKKLSKCFLAVMLALTISFSGACKCDMTGGGISAAYYYCVNKLENADLSFNFDGNAQGATLTSLETNANGDLIYTCEEGDYYQDEGWHTYFGWQTFELEDLSKQARMRIDDLTQTVTVLNKLVVFNGVTARYIGYDEANDVVTGFIGYIHNDYIQDQDEGIDSDIVKEGVGSTDGGEYVDPNALLPKDTLTGAVYIKIYDEDGVEVVEFSTFEYLGKYYEDPNKGRYLYTYIKNSPQKEYIVERSTLFTNASSLDILENEGTSSIFRAIKQDGKFVGSKAEFDYSKSNPLVSGEAFVELDKGYYVLDLADETNRYFSIGYGSYDLSDEAEANGEHYLPLTMLKGWDSIVHYVEDKNYDNVIDQFDYEATVQGPIDISDDDYILLDNGKKITAGMLWSKEDGFITLNNAGAPNDDVYYTKEDGTVIPYTEFQEYANNADYEFLCFTEIPIIPFPVQGSADFGKLISGGIKTSIYGYHGGGSSGGVVESTPSGGVESAPSGEGETAPNGGEENNAPTQSTMSLCFDFMVENGLTISGFGAGELYTYNETAKTQRNAMVQAQFNAAFNYDFNAQGVSDLKDKIVQDTKDFVSNCRTYYTTFERMIRKNMPKLEEGAGLVNLENAAKGTFAVTNGKFDFSNVSITVPKHILLQSGETYGIKVYLTGAKDVEVEGVFNTFTYNKQETICVGNSNVVIPDVTEGEYIVKAVFGKIKNGRFMELSSNVFLDSSAFETIQKSATIDGNNYDITIENLGGRFMMTSVLNNGANS
ncbi:MAG: hypothetical protein IKV61_03210 [Clostridia bacterium]|nr:hypothetical protein [Clostridia bacterium]